MVIFAMLLGGVVFGYIVGVFAGLISNQDQQKKRYRDEMRDLNSLVKETRASKAQAKELRTFFKFLAVSRTMSMSAYHHLLQRMSPAMRGQVTRMTDNNWVERLPYFRNVPEAFVVELVQALGYQAYPPGEGRPCALLASHHACLLTPQPPLHSWLPSSPFRGFLMPSSTL